MPARIHPSPLRNEQPWGRPFYIAVPAMWRGRPRPRTHVPAENVQSFLGSLTPELQGLPGNPTFTVTVTFA
jgi:hypothetical protein